MSGVRQTALRLVVDTLRDPLLSLWCLYIFLFPVYVFKSGLPQPGDWLILPLALLSFGALRVRLLPASMPPIRSLLAFIAYVVLVNLTWSIALDKYTFDPKDGFLLAPIFYVYNAVLFIVALRLYSAYRARFLWLTFQCVFWSLVVQFALSFVVGRLGGMRGTVLFNNPNQLGYYAVLSASILAVDRYRTTLGTVHLAVAFILSGYLALISASRAAIVAIPILACITMITRPRTIAAVLLSIAIGYFLSKGYLDEHFKAMEARFDDPQEASLMEGRGYDRIAEHKQYWLLGAGQGGYRRFEDTTVIGAHELHSSAGTVFFSFGLVGSILFMAFLLRTALGAEPRVVAVLVPVAIYGLSHQGLRFSLLWILLALVIVSKELRKETARSRASPP